MYFSLVLIFLWILNTGLSIKHDDDLRESYLHLLQLTLTGAVFDELGSCNTVDGCKTYIPYNHTLRKSGDDWPVVGHTMVGISRLKNVRFSIEEVVKNHVPGDFMELGVWRGGVCIYARLLLNLLGQKSRQVHVFDVFEPLASYAYSSKYLCATLSEVRHNF